MEKDNENRRESTDNETGHKVQDGITKESFNPKESKRRGVVVTDDIPNSDDDEEEVNEESDTTHPDSNPDKIKTSPEVLVEKEKRPERPRNQGFGKQ